MRAIEETSKVIDAASHGEKNKDPGDRTLTSPARAQLRSAGSAPKATIAPRLVSFSSNFS